MTMYGPNMTGPLQRRARQISVCLVRKNTGVAHFSGLWWRIAQAAALNILRSAANAVKLRITSNAQSLRAAFD